MRGGRLRLIRIVAFILVIGLVIFSPLSGSSSEKAARVDMNVPQQFARASQKLIARALKFALSAC